MNKMNTALPKIAAKLRKYNFFDNPYVLEYRPFVCLCNAIDEPFICKNIPNDRLQVDKIRDHGFTLIELVVTMAVAAILVTVAIPNMRTFIQNNRLITQTNNLIGDINYARSESLRRTSANGQPLSIGICASTSGTACTGGTWAGGYLVFVDANNDGAWDGGDTVLRFREALVADNTVFTQGPLIDPLIFIKGTASSPGGAARSIIYCDGRGPTHGKMINLNIRGVPAVNSAPPASCN
jgi:type IV fimbrial biogenesis protein FimT